jgi:NADH:ubiquinone oxidoreductase subunit E
VVLVNDTVFGEVTPDQIPALIESHIKKAQSQDKEGAV